MSKSQPYNWKWAVTIKKGLFMTGTYRFRTKKDANTFVEQWKRAPSSTAMSYDDLPMVRKVS